MQESIVLMVDVAGALRSGTLEGHVQPVAARVGERRETSDDVNQGRVRQAIGVHRLDGSIVEDVTLNWRVRSLQGLPGAVAEGWPVDVDGNPAPIDDVLAGGHVDPKIVDITGQAVDDGVMFPALYGSPDATTQGLYWSATVDTHKVGDHHFEVHVALPSPRIEDGTVIWDSVLFTMTRRLEVRQAIVVNGFTGSGLGTLPLAVDPPARTGHEEVPLHG